MSVLDPDLVGRYRAETYRQNAVHMVRTVDDARQFVSERGFIFFWPITGVTMPSLWTAVAGDRPVANEHDDPGHVTWGWKDQSLDKRWWYYAKVLRGKATLISHEFTSYFYALSENYGEPERDFLEQYQDGLLSIEAKSIYEALLAEGAVDTVNLRRITRMTNKASNSPFERALTHLQRDFKILPVGVAETGAWRYSFIYDCVHRWYPDLPERARAFSRRQARQRLVEAYLVSVGAATFAEMRKVFQWKPTDLKAALQSLAESQTIIGNFQMPDSTEECFVLMSILS
ncbi:MAG: winged helix DNA-binding domain-containing protein [Caldilineales bacterium]|nr:winged helix DNA-binding domain-containing protein [Caldilineales bacterium]